MPVSYDTYSFFQLLFFIVDNLKCSGGWRVMILRGISCGSSWVDMSHAMTGGGRTDCRFSGTSGALLIGTTRGVDFGLKLGHEKREEQSSCSLVTKRRRKTSSLEGSGEPNKVDSDEEGEGEMPSPFPDEVLEHVLVFLQSHRDRNSVSLVCKAWFKAEKWSRQRVFVGNCYAVSPQQVIRRFPKLNSLRIKGRPRFADFGFVPPHWGAHLAPWVTALAQACPWMEEFRCKRMTVSDESLLMISRSFPLFKSLVLTSCDGFSTDGLAFITSSCRHLSRLDLEENDLDLRGGEWLSAFPETHTSLVSLNFATVDSPIDMKALERLVERSKGLKSLKVHREVNLEQLNRLLVRAPSLVELGSGSYTQTLNWNQLAELSGALQKCKKLRSLSGFWELQPVYVPSLFLLCLNLTTLNLSYVRLHTNELTKLMSYCHSLERLLVQDYVGDKGLQAVAASCRNLQELRVYPCSADGFATEEGLIAISEGCPNLKKILYFCKQMTNEAVIMFSKKLPNLTHFRLCILTPRQPDHTTNEPLDKGFGAIVQNCKQLTRLAVSGLLTDRAFEYIGRYGKKLETISIAFAGESDRGMEYMLTGCTNLRKLEIRDCPFGDAALIRGVDRYEHMRSLWMSGCQVSRPGAVWLAKQKPNLNVEVINEDMGEDCSKMLTVEKLYVYRTIAGPRNDAPEFVETLK
ncbi:hypothetical protein R1flu_003883 [Riccia fluitans]|uniref:Transport inhibitor response 1 n=1 Tax=Riccia fluitans TaxID=41844 RepID=A0ABD1YA98_9MARC